MDVDGAWRNLPAIYAMKKERMSGATVVEFLAYWQSGRASATCGAATTNGWPLVPGKRVLEVGCGLGFRHPGTACPRGWPCWPSTCCPSVWRRPARDGGAMLTQWLEPDVRPTCQRPWMREHRTIEGFAPDTVVCWLMGAPADTTGAAAE